MPAYNIANFNLDEVSTSVQNVANFTKEKFESFLKECLNPYGISTHSDMRRVTILEYKNRVGKPIENCDRYQVFVDGSYAFTIVGTTNAIESEGSWTYLVKYKKIVEEGVK